MFPPKPSLNTGNIFSIAPPSNPNTIPIRKAIVRIFKSLALKVSSSQSLQTLARNPWPLGADSSETIEFS